MKQPNILFLFPDQHRREWLPYADNIFAQWGMQKPELDTPNLARLMAQGVTFLRASTPSPLCAPARACLASGRQYPRCGTPGNQCDYPLAQPTMYQALRAVGYHVLGVGKFDLRKLTCDWFNLENANTLGFTDYIDSEGKIDAVQHYARYGGPRGPYMQFLQAHGYDKMHYDDFDGRKKQTYRTPLPDEMYCDNWITRNALEKIRAVPEGEPWFIQVNFAGPHDPFDVTERMFETVKDRQYEPAHGGVPLENANEIRQCYAAMIENIDRNIGEILALVQARGELENTVIVYASDHGELLGDHGRYAKSRPERGSIDIPCIISVPHSMRKGETEEAIVELQDLTNTFLELAGARLDSAVDSKSLVPLLDGTARTHRDVAFSALTEKTPEASFETVFDTQYKYVAYQDGTCALYDLTRDVWEDHNIAAQHPDLAAHYAQLLGQYRVLV